MSTLASVPPDPPTPPAEPTPLPTHVSEVDALRLDLFATKRQAFQAQLAMLAEKHASVQRQQAEMEAEFVTYQSHLVATYGVNPAAGDSIDVGTRKINRKG